MDASSEEQENINLLRNSLASLHLEGFRRGLAKVCFWTNFGSSSSFKLHVDYVTEF